LSSRRKRVGPSISSYVGLIRFYEEVEEQVKINPYIMLIIAVITPIIVLVFDIIHPFKP